MINLNDKQKQLSLTDQELSMVCEALLIKPNEDNEISLVDSKRLSDWEKGYRETSAIAKGVI